MKMNHSMRATALAVALAIPACSSGSGVQRVPTDSGSNGTAGRSGDGGTADVTTFLPPPDVKLDVAPVDLVPIADGEACATSTQKLNLMPLDLGLLVDTSASMDYENKWIKVSGALGIVSQSPRYLNVAMALQYFPLRLSCDEAGYAKPPIEMGVLPVVGDALRTSLAGQRMSGGTPLVQALDGMGSYMAHWAEAHPDHRTVLVVATDGIPDGTCSGSTPPNSLAEAVLAAGRLAGGEAYKNAPKVPVYVIGVGSELTSLNSIAESGGTGKATLISTAADVDKQFIAALDAIRNQTLTCDYTVPPPEKGSLDFNAVNVSFSDYAGKETLLSVSQANCDKAGDKGWYYDNPTKPTKVVLCPQTCERVNTSRDGQINFVYGCQRIEFIP
jgi:hypothetical protein